MSVGFVTWLAIAVGVILAGRFVCPGFPLRGAATHLTVTDATLAAAGLLGLAFHCGAMFFRSSVDRLPGADSAIRSINALGTASIVWYVVPAVLVTLGLRRQHPAALILVAVALAAVGYTMYDGGSLTTHLRAIFVAVVILAGIAAALVLPPMRHGRAAMQR